MNPLTKKILIAATTLFTLGVVAWLYLMYKQQLFENPEEVLKLYQKGLFH